jgi:hypothetical protein
MTQRMVPDATTGSLTAARPRGCVPPLRTRLRRGVARQGLGRRVTDPGGFPNSPGPPIPGAGPACEAFRCASQPRGPHRARPPRGLLRLEAHVSRSAWLPTTGAQRDQRTPVGARRGWFGLQPGAHDRDDEDRVQCHGHRGACTHAPYDQICCDRACLGRNPQNSLDTGPNLRHTVSGSVSCPLWSRG